MTSVTKNGMKQHAAKISYDRYSELFREHFSREMKDFASFIIHELDIDYQSKILELNSGAGWMSLELARRLPEAEIIGIEQNVELVRLANQHKMDENIDNVNFVNGVIENVDKYFKSSYDLVISFYNFSNWNDQVQTLKCFKKLLQNNGKFAIRDYRKDVKRLAKIFLWYIEKTMPPDFRFGWKEKRANSFTLEQAVHLILKAKLKNWKIRSTLFDFLIYKS